MERTVYGGTFRKTWASLKSVRFWHTETNYTRGGDEENPCFHLSFFFFLATRPAGRGAGFGTSFLCRGNPAICPDRCMSLDGDLTCIISVLAKATKRR